MMPATHTTTTVRDLLRAAEALLREAGCEETRLHAELLLGSVMQMNRAGLLANGDRSVDPERTVRFRALVERRARREPLQYILGDTEFLGLRLTVTPAVLIPRPETELLVEHAAGVLPRRGAGAPVTALDIGTGSGNIAIGLAVLRPDAEVTAMDSSAEALAVAEGNAARHVPGRIRFIRADMFADLPLTQAFDLVIANPPYLSAEEFRKLPPEIRDHEPAAATTDGADGLRAIRRVAALGMRHLNHGAPLLMEIGFGQAEEATGILRREGFGRIRTIPDYAGIERIAEAFRP